MFPRSTTLGCFLLFIILLVTSFWEPLYVFAGIKKWYDKDSKNYVSENIPGLEYICLLVSFPFLLLTFMVYSILPDLQNMHGYTLRAHVASLFVSNVVRLCCDTFPICGIGNYCLSMAYIISFSFLSSLFWLNVICFDTWWTLRQFRSYRINLKKQEKKMFIIYSIYAWGVAFIFNVVCAILDIPSISKHLNTSPEICVERFWFSLKGRIYFHVPVGISAIINIWFFIAMTLRIWHHDKQTANQLRHSRSNHHNKNKLAIYMKLSVVLGITWIMDIILWAMWNFEVMDMLQGVFLFLAFVWKKNIMLLLKKRFGCQVRDSINISRNNDHHCTSLNPITPHTVEIMSMQETSPFNRQINHHVESYSESNI